MVRYITDAIRDHLSASLYRSIKYSLQFVTYLLENGFGL